MLSRIHACMQLLKEKRHRRAAHLALEALGNHPASSELMHLLAEAEAAVKWYPHFRDALVQVTLTGPATTFTIGDVLTVKYNYSHQKPEHENKKFKPFSDSLQGLVTRHDQKVMRNSHLPQEQVDRVLQKVGGVEALNNMRTAENHTDWLARTLPKLPVSVSASRPVFLALPASLPVSSPVSIPAWALPVLPPSPLVFLFRILPPFLSLSLSLSLSPSPSPSPSLCTCNAKKLAAKGGEREALALVLKAMTQWREHGRV